MRKTIAFLALLLACASVNAYTIRVMFVYTPGALAEAGGLSALNALIGNNIIAANTAFNQSGITSVSTQVQNAAPWSPFAITTEFATLNGAIAVEQGALGTLQARDKTSADAVFIITDTAITDPKECGQAMQIHATAYTAFAAVSVDCMLNLRAFQHELGHLLSLEHDTGHVANPNSSYYLAGHGWQQASGPIGPRGSLCFHTIMSYPIEPSPYANNHCTSDDWINYWSNPSIYYGAAYPWGDYLGDGTYANEASVFSAGSVSYFFSNFRNTPISLRVLYETAAGLVANFLQLF